MPLGQGIADLFGAIPARIELTGQDPTWRVTGATFDDALAYVEERFDDAAVIDREDRDRWWPRVTLVVTTDPQRAAAAPPLAELREAAVQQDDEPVVGPPETVRDSRSDGDPAEPLSPLEEIFAHQELVSPRPVRLPRQRGRRRAQRNSDA
jgi:hypothetical protein